MAEAAVDVPIVKEDPAPVDVVVDAKAAPEDKAPKSQKIISEDEGIESLKAQAEKAKAESARRLQEADRKIQAAFQEASAAKQETVLVKRDQIGTIIDNLTKDKDAAKRDYAAALKDGEYEKAADAQDRISMANSKIVAAERGRVALEEEAKNPVRQVQQQPTSDPIESVARTLSPEAGNWVRQHPQHVVNGALSSAALSAHYSAVDKGCAPDSAAYFEHINAALESAGRQPRHDEGRDMNRAPVSAPVGRDMAQAPGAQRPGTIRLQPHEVQSALDTFQPLYPKASRQEILQMYAKNKQELIEEGKIGRVA